LQLAPAVSALFLSAKRHLMAETLELTGDFEVATEVGVVATEAVSLPPSSTHGGPGKLLGLGSAETYAAAALRDLVTEHHQQILQRFDLQEKLLRQALQEFRSTEITPAMAMMQTMQSAEPAGSWSIPAAALVRKARRESFTPLKFQTFEEEEKARRDAAVEESKHHSSAEQTGEMEIHREGLLSRIVNRNSFEMFFTCVVLTNSIFIGIEVQIGLQSSGESPAAIRAIQYLYTTLFTVELLLRMIVHGRQYFWNEDWLWNWLDIFIVSTSLWELGVDIVSMLSKSDGEVASLEGVTGLKAFRIVRVTRIAKTVRLLHIFRFILALRMLITSIINTLKSLLWAIILLVLIIYVFAVIFTQSVNSFLREDSNTLDPELEPNLVKYFGSLTDSMLSLFMSIAGGISWVEVISPLRRISEAWVFLFLFYISFTYFAVLNVVTAVFCQSAIEGAQNDHAAKVQAVLADKASHLEKIRALFSQFGCDDGVITYAIFEDKIDSPAVKEYFATLGLDVYDAWQFFKLLDLDGGGAVEIEEFLMGCLRLRGQATAMEMAKVMNDLTWLIKSQGMFHTYVEVELKHLKEDLFGRPSVQLKADDAEDAERTQPTQPE